LLQTGAGKKGTGQYPLLISTEKWAGVKTGVEKSGGMGEEKTLQQIDNITIRSRKALTIKWQYYLLVEKYFSLLIDNQK